jgi:sortase A
VSIVARRLSRRAGTTLIVAGVVLMVYAATIVLWRDPVTDLWTAYQQHELTSALHHENSVWKARVAATPQHKATRQDAAAELTAVRGYAHIFAAEHQGHDGQALGRIRIPRFGLSEIFVEGTDYWGSLTKGPGRYSNTSFPGLGKTTAIAGHRTTWSAPFRDIDSLRMGDPITLEMPYGTFVYRVTGHRIVRSGDWSIIRNVGYDQLVLSACHPLYSASHRYVIFARLMTVTPVGQTSPVAAGRV